MVVAGMQGTISLFGHRSAVAGWAVAARLPVGQLV